MIKEPGTNARGQLQRIKYFNDRDILTYSFRKITELDFSFLSHVQILLNQTRFIHLLPNFEYTLEISSPLC